MCGAFFYFILLYFIIHESWLNANKQCKINHARNAQNIVETIKILTVWVCFESECLVFAFWTINSTFSPRFIQKLWCYAKHYMPKLDWFYFIQDRHMYAPLVQLKRWLVIHLRWIAHFLDTQLNSFDGKNRARKLCQVSLSIHIMHGFINGIAYIVQSCIYERKKIALTHRPNNRWGKMRKVKLIKMGW